MTVDYGWNDEIDSDSTASEESLDAYVDIDSGTIRINAEQLASHNFDGGIPRSVATNPYSTSIKNILSTSIKRGDYIYLTITPDPITNELVGSFLAADESEVDDDADESVFYNDNLHLVLDIEYSDETEEAPLYIYLYLEIDGERTKVRIPGKVTKTISGFINSTAITVSPDNTELTTGMLVTGTGVNTDTVITNISGTSLTVSKLNTGTVSGTGTFITAFSIVREGSSLSDWDAGTEGWLLTSAGNAIFSNVLVRGTVDASTFQTRDNTGAIATLIPANGNIILRGTNASTGEPGSLYVVIDTSDSDISSVSDTAGFNIQDTAGRRLSIDANEMQASDNSNANTLSLNPFGGNIVIGGGDLGGGTRQTNTLKIWGTTTTPSTVASSAIQASGNISTTGDMYANQFITSDDGTISAPALQFGNAGIYVNSDGRMGFTVDGINEAAQISSGGVILANEISSQDGAVGDPSYTFTTDTLSGMYKYGTSQIGFTVSGTNGGERFRISNTGMRGVIPAARTTDSVMDLVHNATAQTGISLYLYSQTASSTSYNFFSAANPTGTMLRGQGNGRFFAQNQTIGAADYAEYFEWEDGNINNEDRVGYSVCLIENKIKIAEQGDIPIGIVSSLPGVSGDAAWDSWNEKFLRDEFGRYLEGEVEFWSWTELIDGKEVNHSYQKDFIPENILVPENKTISFQISRIISPSFNPNLEYIPRSERKEWSEVGLLGKLRMRKGQPVAPSWIKLRNISENIEEWLVK